MAIWNPKLQINTRRLEGQKGKLIYLQNQNAVMAAEALTNINLGKDTREQRGPAVKSTMLVYQTNKRTQNIKATQINIITNTWGRQLGTGGQAGTTEGGKKITGETNTFR